MKVAAVSLGVNFRPAVANPATAFRPKSSV
ncbi:unannotated protein [freshwater metagenome]|uniref:Unannotated protein n=1 Tax=freshwater metagenome TaxID=449393 RepID=A0A6J7GMQ9_9ZZZZ